jgi:hypothetical protein
MCSLGFLKAEESAVMAVYSTGGLDSCLVSVPKVGIVRHILLQLLAHNAMQKHLAAHEPSM